MMTYVTEMMIAAASVRQETFIPLAVGVPLLVIILGALLIAGLWTFYRKKKRGNVCVCVCTCVCVCVCVCLCMHACMCVFVCV